MEIEHLYSLRVQQQRTLQNHPDPIVLFFFWMTGKIVILLPDGMPAQHLEVKDLEILTPPVWVENKYNKPSDP
jgi:hypothetical protein